MDTVVLDRRPGLVAGYAAALLPVPRCGVRLPDTELVLPGYPVDRAHLARYQRVCGFDLTDTLPASYPQVLAFPVAVRLMTDRAFPFPMAGLVHVRNRIRHLRPVGADEPLTVAVHAEGLAPHRRGTTLDVVTRVSVAGEQVLLAVATYLRRGRPRVAGTPVADTPVASVDPSVRWSLPADLGREYAAVSGDRNPIHLSRLTSRPFGYRRAIVHGMWSVARCLAALSGRLPDRYTVDVRFVRPVPLPARVGFGARGSGDGWRFAVSGRRDGRVLVAGTVAAT